MMHTAILVDYEEKALDSLKQKIKTYCPQIDIYGQASSFKHAHELIRAKNPDIIFVEVNMPKASGFDLLQELRNFNLETIIVSNLENFAIDAFMYKVSGYLLKPVQIEHLISAVNKAQNSIFIKEEYKKNKELLSRVLSQHVGNELIGIPTIKGLDFFIIKDIIRCEGLQKCTRIVTREKSNIVSSYNLGEFRKTLEVYGFFSPHKSHLINLSCIKQYNREGTITMVDNSSVPISRRKKHEFLKCMAYLKSK